METNAIASTSSVLPPLFDHQSQQVGSGNSTTAPPPPLKRARRQRVQYSCTECHRRKQKCDRRFPCKWCIGRGFPQACHPPKDNAASERQNALIAAPPNDDLAARLERLEALLQATGKPEPPPPAVSAGDSENPEHEGDEDEEDGSEQDDAGALHDTGFMGQTAIHSLRASSFLQSTNSDAISSPQSPYSHSVPAPRTADPVSLNDVLLRGVPLTDLTDLQRGLPSRHVCDTYVNNFFNVFNWSRFPLSESRFRTSYETFFESVDLPFPFQNLTFTALLFSILAVGSLQAAIQPDPSPASQSLLWSTKKVLMMCEVVAVGDLDLVWANATVCKYFAVTRRMRESWFAIGVWIRLSLDLGLHRDGTEFSLEDDVVSERRILWSHILHVDRSWAQLIGRPLSVPNASFTTKPPAFEDIKPPDFALANFLVARGHLTAVMGKISTFTHKGRSHSYAHVLELDKELSSLIENFPPSMRHDILENQALDAIHPHLAFYRHLVVSEVYFVRILMHRPYMLKAKGKDDKYQKSRHICVETAKADLRARKMSLQQLTENERVQQFGGAYARFNSSIICGMALSMGETEDVVEMLEYLQEFVGEIQERQQDNKTTAGEREILELVLKKFNTPAPTTQDMAMWSQASSGVPLDSVSNNVTLPLDPQSQVTFESLFTQPFNPNTYNPQDAMLSDNDIFLHDTFIRGLINEGMLYSSF